MSDDMVSIEEELVHLRAENARLRAELESQGPVRILSPEIHAVWPTRIEMKELFDAVNTHWPRDFENVEHDAFARAFRVLGGFHRQAERDTSHTAGHWVSVVNACLSRNVASKEFVSLIY